MDKADKKFELKKKNIENAHKKPELEKATVSVKKRKQDFTILTAT